MLKIFNNLRIFIEDNYAQYSVRQYARLMKMSPPTASKTLKEMREEKLLNSTAEYKHLFFKSNRANKTFTELSQIYWIQRFEEIGLLEYFEKKLVNPSIILFGSLSKAETKTDSDADIAIIANKKELELKEFENKLKRKIQIFWLDSISQIKNKELTNNIINGTVLMGRLKL